MIPKQLEDRNNKEQKQSIKEWKTKIITDLPQISQTIKITIIMKNMKGVATHRTRKRIQNYKSPKIQQFKGKSKST